ncbi:MAG: hypothetical protein LBM98_09725 [Oscillospiraceae bacterium]|nr:hypothetical protein [Oscillospiraceae bacterium]
MRRVYVPTSKTFVLIPSVEGCRRSGGVVSPAGRNPRVRPLRPGAARRLCEAPVSPRYVGRYRCEAIQCRRDNIRPTSRRTVIASRAKLSKPRYPRPNPYPLCGGVPPVAAGWFPRRAQPPSNPTSLIFDI